MESKSKELLTQLADLLPADVWWGDAITPTMLVDILDKYAAARQEPAQGQDEREAFEAWWDDFAATHEDWRYADAHALRFQAWQAALASRQADGTDWKDMYEKANRRAEMWASKYVAACGDQQVIALEGKQPVPEKKPRSYSVAYQDGNHRVIVPIITCHEDRNETVLTIPAPHKEQPVPDEREATKSPTYGMNLGDRIAHVGGRVTEYRYVEFGSVMAVDALIKHVLRDSEFDYRAALASSTHSVVQAVPEAKTEHRWDDDSERSYIQGWNDCREEMIAAAQQKEKE